jgi:hypothetical protein
MRAQNFRGNTQKIVCRLHPLGGTFLPLTTTAHTALARPAPEEPKEVHDMTKSTWTISQPAGITMPLISRDRRMSVRALPVTQGVVSLVAGTTRVQGTGVCGYARFADVVDAKGVFPGTSAWSPPI